MIYLSDLVQLFTALIAHPLLPLFMLVNIGISLWVYFKRNNHTYEGYAMASRNLPTGVLVMTLLGTYFSGDHFAFVGWVTKLGILQLIPVFAIVAVFFVIGTFMAPSLVHFEGMKTMGDIIGRFYGRIPQILSGIIGLFFSVIFITGQLKGIGACTSHFLGIEPFLGITCFGGLIMFFSAWGGMRSISYNDVIKMIFILLMVTGVVSVALHRVEGLAGLTRSLPPMHKQFFSHPNFWGRVRMITASWLIPSCLLTPPIMQRMLISNKQQVRQMWYVSALVVGVVFILLYIVTLSALPLGVTLDTNNSESITSVFLRVVNTLFSSIWIRDCVCIGMLAVSFSTLDSYLHALGILFVQDLILPIRDIRGLPPVSEKRKTQLAQAAMMTFAKVALLISHFSGASLAFIKLGNTALFFSPMVLVPLFIGLCTIKTNDKSWLTFCMAYLLSMSLWYYLGWYQTYYFESVAFASFIGIIAYMTTHIYLHRGIVTVHKSNRTVAEQLWLPRFSDIIGYLGRPFSALGQLPTLAARKLVDKPTHSLGMSIVTFLVYAFSALMHGGLDVSHATVLAYIHIIGITLCCGLMLEGIWSERIKKYFPLYWFITLGYCLPFGSTLTLLETHACGGLGVYYLFGNLLLLAFLVESAAFSCLTLSGVGLALGGWRIFTGSIPMPLLLNTGASEIYIFAMFILGLYLFGKANERHLHQRFLWNRTASGMLGHDLRPSIQMLQGVGLILERTLEDGVVMTNKQGEKGLWVQKHHTQFLSDYTNTILKKSGEAMDDIHGFMDFIKTQIKGGFEQQPTGMLSIVQAAEQRMQDALSEHLKITVVAKKDFDAKLLSIFPNVIINLVRNASIHGRASEVTITVDGTNRTLQIHDNGRGISADILPRIFDLNFTTGAKDRKGHGIGLSFVKMVVEASAGHITCESRHGDPASFTNFTLTFPLQE